MLGNSSGRTVRAPIDSSEGLFPIPYHDIPLSYKLPLRFDAAQVIANLTIYPIRNTLHQVFIATAPVAKLLHDSASRTIANQREWCCDQATATLH
jgi:hypothetical protein